MKMEVNGIILVLMGYPEAAAERCSKEKMF